MDRSHNNGPVSLPKVIMARSPEKFLCVSFYAFVFLIPFEALDIGIEIRNITFAKLMGFVFLGFALLQPKVCFKRPCPALLWFFGYLLVYGLLGIFQENRFESLVITYLITFIQLLILFWILQNLMMYEDVAKGAFLSLGISCFFLAVLVLSGVLSTEVGQSRITAEGFNANTYAALLSLGLLALIGLATNRRITNYKVRGFAWLSFSFLAVAIVQSGSRSSLLALILGFCVLMFQGRGLKVNPKALLIILIAVGVVSIVLFQSQGIWERWERTIVGHDTAGRDKIYSRVADMIIEKPLLGWGPVTHYFELGSRVGKQTRDPHSLYFWVLLEGGILGAVPFFVGLWLCWQGAWRSRVGSYGRLPMALLLYMLLVNLNHSYQTGKFFWLILAFATASGKLASSQKMIAPISESSELVSTQ